jgi:hypothetical protein
MTKRYREALDAVMVEDPPSGRGGGGAPTTFHWRGQQYRVLQVLGHWREDPGWWRRPDGQPIRIEQTDLWRVEARNGTPTRGVYELVCRNGEWLLDRVWD